mmetsp:Transcript_72/g.205  ORF Transcript_72/g.205 Transcript_72/m.205 type:complete len:152 (+) Transcript_72:874-1329(+)
MCPSVRSPNQTNAPPPYRLIAPRSLQPPDAKIPFSTPWLDDVERKIARRLGMATDALSPVPQPYLSNLAVAESFRGRGIGGALVRLVEKVAIDVWNYDRLYLHVDDTNDAAVDLYRKYGFNVVRGVRWSPIWAGDSAKIAYFVKTYPATKP